MQELIVVIYGRFGLLTIEPTSGRYVPAALPLPRTRRTIEELSFYSAHDIRLMTALTTLAPISTHPPRALSEDFEQ